MLGDNCPKCGYPLVGGTCDNLCDRFPEYADLHQQLALAERRLKIAEAALERYADRLNWDRYTGREVSQRCWIGPEIGNGWEPAENALKDMENVKHGS